MKVTMQLDRETKGTQVYKCSDDDSPIPSLYIKKSAFGKNEAPATITVDIKEIK